MGVNVNNKTNMNKLIKYSDVLAGESLYKFITHIDTVKSSIGEYRKANNIGTGSLIVTGVQLENLDNPINLLSDTSVNLEVNGKFNNFMDKPPIQLLKMYMNTLVSLQGDSHNQAVLNKFKRIIASKDIVIPFKPGADCTFTVKKDDIEHNNITSVIKSVIWTTDKESTKLIGYITSFAVGIGAFTKTYRIPLEEYGASFKILSIERGLKKGNVNRDIIKVTRFGFISPIEIIDGNIRLVIDGSNVFIIEDNQAYLIARWRRINDLGESELVETDMAKSLEKTKAYKHLKANIEYIEKHRRFIAPYGIVDTNKINL